MLLRTLRRCWFWSSTTRHKPALASPLLLATSLAIPLGLISQAAFSVQALNELGAATQTAITRNCEPVHFTQGPTAYRNCLLRGMESAKLSTNPIPDKMNNLSLDEQFAAQSICLQNTNIDSPAFVQCLDQQLQDSDDKTTRLSSIDPAEQYAIGSQCFAVQTNSGVQAYKRCVDGAIDQLARLPATDFAKVSAPALHNLQLDCSLSTQNAVAYRSCLLNALDVNAEQTNSATGSRTGSFSATAVIAQANTGDAEVTNDATGSELFAQQPATQTSQQEPVNTQEPSTSENTPVTDVSNDSSPAATTEPETPAANIEDNVESTALTTAQTESDGETLSDTNAAWYRELLEPPISNWLVSSALLSTLLLFVGIGLNRRDSENERVHSTADHDASIATQASRNTHSKPAQPDLSAVSLSSSNVHPEHLSNEYEAAALSKEQPLDQHFSDEQTEHETDQSFHADAPYEIEHGDIEHGEIEHGDIEQGNIKSDKSGQTPAPVSTSALAAAPGRHGFDKWLDSFAASQQRDICSELLILYMAYADNRFKPELKKHVFEMKDPDTRDLTKRWAFKRDAQALACSIKVMQTQTNRDQRIQFIDLLMALLVTERAITPIQNNFLRFLADQFGIGCNILERNFLRAFGHPMPPLPRPDKQHWWDKQSDDSYLLWDARAVSELPEDVRNRILLGLPLEGELKTELVQLHYRRAAARCHRNKINQLGEHEYNLLETRRKKFEQARDALLEITA